ncbi:MAG: hypothetical protein Q8927_08515 [Bacteroidota bacterium]|nr:hypothetical protein [Bacteroidota bacterium]
MLKAIYLGCLLLSGLCYSGHAQQRLGGKVVRKGSAEVLPDVSIINLNQKKYNVSDLGGNYRIPAAAGDTILFTSAGYLPDTIVASAYMFLEDFLVPLRPRIMALPAVLVDEASNYQIDSIKRREEYASLLNKRHPITLMNEKRPKDGPGFSFSPFGYFSSTEVRKRRLKKRLRREEEDYYVDYKFPRARVAQLTQLRGDSLQIFMVLYRPSYKFCRSANSEDMFLYINDKLKAFRRSTHAIKL